jgi:uncharacterized damage-inducible protein DinB
MAESERILVELLRGKGAHADPTALIRDITFATSARTLTGFPHSIWQIVWHMNYWMDYEIKRIQGDSPAYPDHAADSWPTSTAPKDSLEWEGTAARFPLLIAQIARIVESEPETLHRDVEPMHAVHRQQSSSRLAVLWQLVAHNSYHVGQIVLMQQAFGAWSQQRGDSW